MDQVTIDLIKEVTIDLERASARWLIPGLEQRPGIHLRLTWWTNCPLSRAEPETCGGIRTASATAPSALSPAWIRGRACTGGLERWTGIWTTLPTAPRDLIPAWV